MRYFLLFICFLLPNLLIAKEKQLILAEGNSWLPMMPNNLVVNYNRIKELPFDGFVIVGNSYTDKVMKSGVKLTYRDVWSEVKGLKNLYGDKKNFMRINMDFPEDFWNNRAWRRVTDNFAIVARVAKNLGFTGIAFDDEPYSKKAMKMNNFRFPTQEAIDKNPKRYALWKRLGSQPKWVDIYAYRNSRYSFKEHMEMVTKRFKDIMEAMSREYPKLTTLVYNGPSFAHENSNSRHITVINVGLPREHEYKGAIFTGLKKGLGATASLHDMGESYRYRTHEHFKNSYRWRKYDIAKNGFNDSLDSSYQWIVPKEERESWSSDVEIGFMVFNKGQNSSMPEYDTREKSSIKDIEETLKKALYYSDEFVLYYCQEQHWLLPNKEFPLEKSWIEMMQRVNR